MKSRDTINSDQKKNKKNPIDEILEGSEGLLNNRYEIIEKIGEGGFGTIFKASDKLLKKDVALKFLDPAIINDEKKSLRVKREVNTSQKISDGRVVKIFSLEYYNEIPFLVMEFVDGKSLKELIEENGKISWKEFKPLFLNILGGVNSLHEKGIIHRDLKPSNIIITEERSTKIVDFGLSKELGDTEKTSSLGEIIGTPMYMSPEQIQGRELDIRSDIYQLGLVLYRSISGDFNYEERNSTLQQMLERLGDNSKKIFRFEKFVPSFLKFGVFKSLEKDRDNRFQSVDEMIGYFREENYPFLGKILHLLKKYPLRTLSILMLFLSIVLSGSYFVSNSRAIKSVKYEGSVLKAFNPFGIKLWEKDFKPYKISELFKMDEKTLTKYDIGNRNYLTDKNGYIVLLNNPRVDQDISIASGEFDNKVSFLTNDGNELIKLGFSYVFFIGDYDFIKKYYIQFLEKIDIDGNGEQETIIKIRHFMDMFPTTFVLLKDLNIYSFSNPGTISKTECIEADDKHSRFLIQGLNNILSHIFFVAEVNFNYEINYVKNQTGFPNLKSTDKFYPEFICFLPKFFKNDVKNWNKDGFLIVTNFFTGEEIRVDKDYSLTIKSENGIIKYINSRENLYRIYRNIDEYYQEKMINKNLKKAYRIILDCFKVPFENPYLRSALLYLKGDLEVDMGKFSEGERTLKASLNFYNWNLDSAQRLCEVEFLRDNPEMALKKIFNDFGHISNFWGLSFGKDIFRGFCEIQMGNFSRTEEIYSLYKQKSNLHNLKTLNGILEIFKGDYIKAIELLKKTDNSRIFTIAELRLFLARAMLLSNIDLKRAKFYFNDISVHSLSLSHLAKISSNYFSVMEKRGTITRGFIINTFDELINTSKGDFDTRLWLFYDSFIYGKIMELLRDKKEAIRGYKLCIKSNPYTDLAKRAEARIKSLSTKTL
ncbi:MAG: serine/threonine-protein kinase [Acidobacteriota bacterium]